MRALRPWTLTDRHRIALATSLVCVIALLSPVTPAHSAADWRSQQVSQRLGIAGLGNGASALPVTAVNDAGAAVVVLNRIVGSGYDGAGGDLAPVISIRRSVKARWTRARIFTRRAHVYVEQAMALSDGRFVVLGRLGTAGRYRYAASVSNPRLTRWSPIRPIAGSASSAGGPGLLRTAGDGSATFVWTSSTRVRVTTLGRGATRFGPAATLDSAASLGRRPKLAIGMRGDAVVLWRSANGKLMTARRPAGSNSWSPRIALPASDRATGDADIASAPDGTLAAAWIDGGNDATRQVHGSTWGPSAHGWSTSEMLESSNAPPGSASAVRLSAGPGGVVATYCYALSVDYGNAPPQLRVLERLGDAWSPLPAVLPDGCVVSEEDDDKAVVAGDFVVVALANQVNSQTSPALSIGLIATTLALRPLRNPRATTLSTPRLGQEDRVDLVHVGLRGGSVVAAWSHATEAGHPSTSLWVASTRPTAAPRWTKHRLCHTTYRGCQLQDFATSKRSSVVVWSVEKTSRAGRFSTVYVASEDER